MSDTLMLRMLAGRLRDAERHADSDGRSYAYDSERAAARYYAKAEALGAVAEVIEEMLEETS